MFAIKSVSELGIYRYVRSDRACNLLWRKYITLPLIPPAEIPSRLRELRKCINTNLPTYARRGFRKYHLYVKRFWVKKVRPERFSVFGRRRRTNNGVESMHAVFSRHLVRHGNVKPTSGVLAWWKSTRSKQGQQPCQHKNGDRGPEKGNTIKPEL